MKANAPMMFLEPWKPGTVVVNAAKAQAQRNGLDQLEPEPCMPSIRIIRSFPSRDEAR